jgi:integrase
MHEEASHDRTKRWPTRHVGIVYRIGADGRTRTYYVHFRRKYYKAGRTEREALATQREVHARANRGERVIVSSKRTVREVAPEWILSEGMGWRIDYALEQERLLEKEILPVFGDWLVASIGPADVIAFDRKLRKRGLSESGAGNVLKPLRGLCAHAAMAGDIPISPFALIPRGKLSSCNTRRQHHEWTSAELERFVATAYEFDEREKAQRSYGLQVELMVRLGLRLGEVTGLRFRDIDRKAKVIHVRRQYSKRGETNEYTKTAAGRRRVPLTDELLAKIDFRQSFLGLRDGDFVLAQVAGGNPPSHTNFRSRAWNRIVKKTGLKLEDGVRVTPHSARHATASQLADLELDSDDAAALLGHSSAKVTEGIHVHAFNRDAREERIRKAMTRAQNGVDET